MRIYKSASVYDEALNRIRWLYDEFPTVTVSFSGGKDSTVILNLAVQVAREKGRLPVKVLFIDQEAEWQMVIDYIGRVMRRPDVQPLWYQVPFRIENASSKFSTYLKIWEPGVEWIREKDEIAIKEPPYEYREDTEFYELFNELVRVNANDGPCANLGGVRCEESPSRFVALTQVPTYKWATWGKKLDVSKNQYTFYPIYDWSYTDVWHAIQSNGWEYCALYDYQYRYGIHTRDMRVSNLHHETSLAALFYLQECEPKTYEALCKRMPGIHMAGKMGAADYFAKELPFMFSSWSEYRDYLVEKLVTDPDWIAGYKKNFARMDKIYGAHYGDQLYKMHIQCILTNDYTGTKWSNWENNPDRQMFRKIQKGKTIW
jgi:predicted phosphoadenosine phosphosulfate sulfurtransferase